MNNFNPTPAVQMDDLINAGDYLIEDLTSLIDKYGTRMPISLLAELEFLKEQLDGSFDSISLTRDEYYEEGLTDPQENWELYV